MADSMTARHSARTHPGAPCDFTTPQWERMCEEHEHRCFYCGRPDAKLLVEHKVPLRRGGGHTASNIVPACSGCNTRKGNLTDAEFAPLIDQQKRRANLARPSPMAPERVRATPLSTAARATFLDLLRATTIPTMVLRSRLLSSDAKILYALLRPDARPVLEDEWEACHEVLGVSEAVMAELAKELIGCNLARHEYGRLYILGPERLLQAELTTRTAE